MHVQLPFIHHTAGLKRYTEASPLGCDMNRNHNVEKSPRNGQVAADGALSVDCLTEPRYPIVSALRAVLAKFEFLGPAGPRRLRRCTDTRPMQNKQGGFTAKIAEWIAPAVYMCGLAL